MKIRMLAGAACLALSCFAVANPAAAQDDSGLTVSGEATLVTDYRYRGVSMTDREMAIQAGIQVTHESGFYAGTWGSNLSGWGTFGGSNTELDLFAGYSTDLGNGLNVDAGLTWIMFPGGLDTTDFAELYATVSGDVGPVNIGVGINYAPKQEALGTWYYSGFSDGYDDPGDKGDNLYLHTDLSAGIPDTPLTLNAHFGYSNGNAGLGPWGTSLAPTGEYIDWSLGADYALGPLTLGVAYVDTDISRSESNYLGSGFRSSKNGSVISGSTVVFKVSAGF
ncbi:MULTISPECIES: TorF family putative porin [Novosphingobium]|uniref:Porin n=1 Tax=Novosphingobium decolorationis TaxID=2698673 RepID=A0ABX8E3E7_9SPHN|nr:MULTISPECIES: TorF family putative porin [Novosphingobium]MED5544139.1 TorF family putative porin [Pseudomonadota bacterium]QVM83443.1 hypothetical protein HT578_06855 [Novosphingobium decolorationis]